MEPLVRRLVHLHLGARSVLQSCASARWFAVWSTIVVGLVHAGRADEPSTVGAQLRFRVLPSMEEWGGKSFELHTITLTGHVRDQRGKPVAGANVCVASSNTSRPSTLAPLLARTTTDGDGAFQFRDLELPVVRRRPDPVATPPQGGFTVFGWLDGFGFTWRARRSYRPEPRPDGVAPGDPDLGTTQRAAYAGEPLEVDLLFEPPARLHGRILDDQGQPLAHAKVQVGCCDDIRSASGKGIYCLHRGSTEDHAVNDGLFDAIESLPADLRETRTDTLGQFALNGLRRDTEYQVLIDPDSVIEPFQERIATLKPPSPNPNIQYLGYDGEMNPVIERPRELTVRLIHTENGRPATGVTVRAHGQKIRRSRSLQTTNTEGQAALRLSPGPYTLYFDPPANMDAIAGSTAITVAADPLAQSVDVRIEAGAVVVLQAVDADKGAPVQGVQFLYETETSRQQVALHSQTVFADYPRTNAQGELRAVVHPGRRRFVVGQHPADWQPIATESDLVDLEPERAKTVCFRFKKQTEKPTDAEWTNPLGYPPELIAEWDRQRHLQVQAKCSLVGRHHFRSHELKFSRVAELLDGLDPDTPPDLASVFRELLGEEFPMADSRITVDGVKRRSESRQLGPRPAHESVFVTLLNGKEAVSYRSTSFQADVYAQEKFRVQVYGIWDVCTWPSIVRTGGAAEFATGDKLAMKMTRENGKVTMDLQSDSSVLHGLVNETNGFTYRWQTQSTRRGSGQGRWQFAPRVYPNGMVLPACRVEVRSAGEAKCLVSAFVLQAAEFYEQLPPEAFAVSVPAGVNVLDWRQVPDNGPRQPQAGVVRGPVPDVVAYLNARSAPRGPIKPVLTYGQPAPAIRPAKWLNQTGEILPPETNGKVVLIDFWGIGCGPCVAQLPEVQTAAKHFKDTDLVVIGLHESRAEVEQMAQFATEKHLEFVLAIDREPSEPGWFGATMQAYGVQGIPAVAVIDRAGKLVYVGQLREAVGKAADALKQE